VSIPNEDLIQVSVYFGPQMLSAIDQEAEAKHRSRNKQIVWMVECFLAGVIPNETEVSRETNHGPA